MAFQPTTPMTTTAYTFTAKDGATISFDSYLAFATWFFGISRRVMKAAFDEGTFRIMNRIATRSAAALKPMF